MPLVRCLHLFLICLYHVQGALLFYINPTKNAIYPRCKTGRESICTEWKCLIKGGFWNNLPMLEMWSTTWTWRGNWRTVKREMAFSVTQEWHMDSTEFMPCGHALEAFDICPCGKEGLFFPTVFNIMRFCIRARCSSGGQGAPLGGFYVSRTEAHDVVVVCKVGS